MNSIQTIFSSTYEGAPAVRLQTLKEHEDLRLTLERGGYSYRTKIVPPRGRTHRRPKGRPREIVVILAQEHGHNGFVHRLHPAADR
jgi:hypothetical protein